MIRDLCKVLNNGYDNKRTCYSGSKSADVLNVRKRNYQVLPIAVILI